ncbi:unnamed protein product [Hydatigera taeniaeformis]|uniref:TLC domain-containing protein n=1 Tax=Hydatigena taeniaeformis TaxID=6205 RepID=A0A0R3X2P7_HYDTA|nr:unnamed protein product [Hydatigera taeniaeformis]
MCESCVAEEPVSYDWPRDVNYCYSLWSLASFIGILLFNYCLGPRVFERVSSTYRRLPPLQRLEWNCRVSSTIHATLVTLLSFMSLLFDTSQWADPIASISRPGCIALSITIGYMLAGSRSGFRFFYLLDTISMFTFQRGLELLLFCTHHLVVAICFTFLLVRPTGTPHLSPSVIYRIAPVYAIIRLTSEISTPFLNQRWFYRIVGGKNADRRAANATLVFTCLFTLGRYVLPFPYWVVFYRHFNSKPHLAVKDKLPFFTNCFISCPVLLDILNAAWGYPVFIVTKKALVTLGYIRSTPKRNGMLNHNGGVGSSSYCNGSLHEE